MSVPSLGPLAATTSGGAVATQPTGKAVWLRCVWLNDWQNPSDYMAFPLMSALAVTPTVAGEVRRYAGGVTAAVTRTGRTWDIKMSLPHLTRPQTIWLRDHAGRALCYRDDRGRRHFGVYFAVTVTENRHNTEASADVTMTSVSVSEVV